MENDMEIYHYTNIVWLERILASKHLVPSPSFPSIPKLVWLTEEENPPGTASTQNIKCFRFIFDTSHPDIVPWPDYAKTIEPPPQKTWTAEEVEKELEADHEKRGFKPSPAYITRQDPLHSRLLGVETASYEEIAKAWSGEPIPSSKTIELLHKIAEDEGDLHAAWHVSEIPLKIGDYEEVDI